MNKTRSIAIVSPGSTVAFFTSLPTCMNMVNGWFGADGGGFGETLISVSDCVSLATLSSFADSVTGMGGSIGASSSSCSMIGG
jgi:hypothetical protein